MVFLLGRNCHEPAKRSYGGSAESVFQIEVCRAIVVEIEMKCAVRADNLVGFCVDDLGLCQAQGFE
jgi:hypothetical protein